MFLHALRFVISAHNSDERRTPVDLSSGAIDHEFIPPIQVDTPVRRERRFHDSHTWLRVAHFLRHSASYGSVRDKADQANSPDRLQGRYASMRERRKWKESLELDLCTRRRPNCDEQRPRMEAKRPVSRNPRRRESIHGSYSRSQSRNGRHAGT
jgi:hypothetical protein